MMKTTTVAALLSATIGIFLTGCGNPTDRGPRASGAYSPEGLGSIVSQPASQPGAPADAGEARKPDRQAEVLFVAYVATPQDVVDRMLKLARVTTDDVVYDLGCGDGRIVVTAAKRYGCRAVGYDLDRLRVHEARENAARSRVDHLVTIELKDVLKVDLEEASVVTLYLSRELNARLIPQLRKLKAGARIVAHDFPIGDLAADEVVEMTSRTDRRTHTIYLWNCPLAPQPSETPNPGPAATDRPDGVRQ
jgi:SAM-dependent methyltransferase